MNKSYKSVWNESTGTWVAVSELATGRSKSKRAKKALSKAILTQIAVGGMSLAGAGAAMADEATTQDNSSTVVVADNVASAADATDADGVSVPSQPKALGSSQLLGAGQLLGATASPVDNTTIAFGTNGASTYPDPAVYGLDSIAVGRGTIAAANGVALGTGAKAGTVDADGKSISAYATAIGYQAIATGNVSSALGSNATSSGNFSTALGTTAIASGNKSVALGFGSVASADNVVSVGSSSFTRKIVNVTAGDVNSTSTDAVTGSQLSKVATSAATALGGGSTVASDGTISKPTYTVAGKTYTGLDSALAAAAATGSGSSNAFISTPASTVPGNSDAAVANAGGIAIGGSSVADTGIAIGTSAYTMGSGVAVGQGSQAGADSLAFGSGAAAQNGGMSIGANSYTINNGGVAIGVGASATGAGAMAIGKNSSASASGAVAIGQDSVATGMNTVSVGNATTQRQITNLAAGTKATDAVNVGQLTAAGLVVNSSGVVQNTFVAYDSTAKTGVTLGNGTVGAQIHQVVAGTAATDAVNVKQLTDAGLVVNSSGAVQNGFVAYDAGSAKALISLQGASGTKITNLLAGTVSSSSKDAINGSQLYNVAQSAADALGGSSTVGADGKITKPTYTIDGKQYTSLDGALTAAAATGSGGGNVTNAVTYTDGAHTSVSLGNGTAPVSLKNVATGVDANDAVNVAQLKSATDGLSGITTSLPYIGISKSMSGDAAVATGNNSVAIGGFSYANADNALAFGTKARATAANSVAIGAGSLANKANTVSIGAGNAERRLTNMAAGVDETDGVNLGQMMAYVDNNLVQNVQSSGLLKSSVRSNGLLGASATNFGLNDVMAVGTTDKLNQIEALGADAMAMGLNTHANGDSSVAVGSNTSAAGLASVGVGYGVIVNGNGASAFGVNSSSISDGGFAAGNGAAVQANSNDGVAIGTNAETSGVNGVSVGNTARAWGAGSVAIGGSTKAAGANSVVIGTGSSATTAAAGSVVLGNNNLVTGANTVVLGSNTVGTGTKKNTVSGANSVVLGDGSDGSLSNVVSVGAAGKERRIVNVAAGTTTTDAVNLGQLNSAIAAIPSGGSVSPETVVYDTSAHDKLTFNKSGNPTTLSNVAAGVTANDAVNVGQLTAAGLVVDSTGKATNAFVAYDNNTSKDTITLKGTSGSTKITALTKGTLSATSTDAVNGSQLFNTASSTAAAIGGGAALDPATGTISKPAIKVGDTTFDNVAGAVTAAGTTAAQALAASVDAVKYDTTAHDKVTLGTVGKPVTLTNVADGKTTNDAVNFGQLSAMGAKIGSDGKATNSFVAYDDTSMNTVTLQGASGSTKITKLTKGTLSATSTDAVNGSQLFNTASSTAAAIGGGAALDPATGTISKPAIKVGDTTFDNVAGAVTAAGTTAATALAASVDAVKYDTTAHDKVTLGTVGKPVTLTNVADGKTTYDAVNYGQLSAMGAKIGSDGKVTNSFVAYDDTSMNTVTGLDGRIDSTNNSLTELTTKVSNISTGGTGTATPNAVAYDTDAHDTLTLASTSGGTTKLSGLTDGNVAAGSTDAVTGNQLSEVKDSVTTLQTTVNNIAETGTTVIGVKGADGTNGINGANGVAGSNGTAASANGADAIAMGDNASASGDHAVVIGGGASGTADGVIAIGGNSNASGKDSIAIGNGATAPDNNSVALGAGSTTDRDNSVSIGSEGKERQLTNVAAGTAGTDAVNLNQMNQAVGGVARKAYSGIAAATALTMIPDVDANKTLSIGIGGGTFQGYAATAIGGTARITQNIKVRVGAGWSAAGTTVGAGASYQW